MALNNSYCPVVGICSHQDSKVIPKSFFLIEPFDEYKVNRENAIEEGLNNYYGRGKFTLLTSDREITPKGLYCDICKKIKSCQVCFADITPRKLIQEEPEKVTETLAVKENVMFELGLAFGFGTIVIIISRKIEGSRLIPSDLSFIRYLDNTSDIPYVNWTELSDKLLDHLSGIGGIGNYRRKLPSFQKEVIKQTLKYYQISYHSRKNKREFDNSNLKVKEFRLNDQGNIIAIIPGVELIHEGMLLTLTKIEKGIETPIGILEIFHIQPDKIAQAYCIYNDVEDEKILSKRIVDSNDILPAFDNRLEVYITKEHQDIPIEQLEDIIRLWKTLV